MEWIVGWPDALAPPLWLAMQAGARGAVVVAVAALLVARRRRVAALAGAAGVLAWALAMLLKAVAERPRPAASVVGVSLRDHVDGHGFPSAHAAIAVALAIALVLSLRPPAWSSAVIVAIAVCTGVARVYFGVHWPLDAVGGAAVGVFAGSTVAALAPSR